MKNIIVNADDFGLNKSINKAIVESFNKGFINSTTLMANMPGFEEAVEMAHKYHIIDRIGIHLNLDAGNHLTSGLLGTNLFDKEDHSMNRTKLFFISKNEINLIFKEFTTQIERMKKSGINITHIDTHHHIHEFWPITRIILTLLKEHNISSMRSLHNLNGSTRFYKAGYRKLINKFIKINNANFSDFFGNQLEVSSLLQNHPAIAFYKQIEVMVHPDYNSEGIIIDKINGREHSFEYPEYLVR